jgi:hypothetical protein
MHHGAGEGCGEKVVGKLGWNRLMASSWSSCASVSLTARQPTEGLSLFSAGVGGPPFRSNLPTE